MGAEKEAVEVKIGYTKEQILKSKKYSRRKDILSVLLEENKKYTHEEIKKILNDFDKKAVK